MKIMHGTCSEPDLCDSMGTTTSNNKDNNTDIQQLFLQAFAAGYSRSHADKPSSEYDEDSRFRGKVIPALCPLGDLFNGDSDGTVPNMDLKGRSTKDGDMIVACAVRKIQAGEELICSSQSSVPGQIWLCTPPVRDALTAPHGCGPVGSTTRIHSTRQPSRQSKVALSPQVGISKERVQGRMCFTRPFLWIASDKGMRYYRRLPETCEWGQVKLDPQIIYLMDFGNCALTNENTWNKISQELYIEQWEPAKFVVEQVIDQVLTEMNL